MGASPHHRCQVLVEANPRRRCDGKREHNRHRRCKLRIGANPRPRYNARTEANARRQCSVRIEANASRRCKVLVEVSPRRRCGAKMEANPAPDARSRGWSKSLAESQTTHGRPAMNAAAQRGMSKRALTGLWHPGRR